MDSSTQQDQAATSQGWEFSPMPSMEAYGTPYECGVMLGEAWRGVLSERVAATSRRPWWDQRSGVVSRLVDRHAPHLRDVMRGMQMGAGLRQGSWDDAGSSATRRAANGCTSFSVSPDATLHQAPISGQTKDTHRSAADRYLVLKVKPSGAPAFLALTYPGELFGYGFASTGVSIFRNSLYAGSPDRGLPFHIWGLLSLCAHDVEEVRELTLRFGVCLGGNALVSDAGGNAISVEGTADGIGIVEGRTPVLVHANHVNTHRLVRHERYPEPNKSCSLHRQRRLETLLSAGCGRLSAPSCLHCLADHDSYPLSVCNHTNPPAHETSAAVVAEPTRGRLHVVRGSPCRNWPVTYSL